MTESRASSFFECILIQVGIVTARLSAWAIRKLGARERPIKLLFNWFQECTELAMINSLLFQGIVLFLSFFGFGEGVGSLCYIDRSWLKVFVY